MKYIYTLLTLALISFIMTGCGNSNNISFSTTLGECYNGSTGNPYCMAIKVQNNNGGQNFINSSNYPVSNLGVSVVGASNILSPAISTTQDPNNCRGSTIAPSSSCTFYLQLSGEAYPVNAIESIQINVTYTINDNLFGTSDNTSSTNLTVYELTNLYTFQNNGNLTIYNSSWNNYGLIESNDVINSAAIDTTTYGLPYFAGNSGIYTYSISNNEASSSISTNYVKGSNNLFSNSNYLYAVGITTGTSGIWQWSYTNESWNSSNAIYSIGSNVSFNPNSNAVSSGSSIYLGSSSPSPSIYVCSSSNSSNSCTAEGTNGDISGSVSALGFLTNAPQSITTGLYAGTNSGLYYESNTTPLTPSNATWTELTGGATSINVIASESSNVLYAGDSSGNIWEITAGNPTVATLLFTLPSSPSIDSMVLDSFSGILYVAANSIIYACNFENTPTCSSQLSIVNSNYTQGTSKVMGMVIGSYLTDSTSNPYDSGSLE